MVKFIFKKIAYGFLVLLGVITSIFFLFNVLPGDPATVLLGQRANKEAVEAINRDLGRDKPLVTQYFMYLNDLSFISFHNTEDKHSAFYLDKEKYSFTKILNLGENTCMVAKAPYFRRSYITKRKVSEIIIETLPETAVLAISSIIVATLLGVFLGVIAAIKKDTFFDRLALILSALGMSAPSFFFGVIIAWLFGYVLTDYTGLSPVGSLYTIDVWEGERLDLKNLILPTITLGMRPLAIIVQLTRSSLLDVLSQDYIRTARAKGLTFYAVIVKHALKNALNPVVTAVSGWFAGLMAGAVFVEIIFSWKGIGYEVFEALTKNDLPVVMGATLIFATFFVVINIFVDVIYGILDPRIRVK
ncbi:MAG TPA: ABC transporter permease [Bacteroidia bacterium]|nr:ABC transporter permease [Bacteroidia bacterium]